MCKILKYNILIKNIYDVICLIRTVRDSSGAHCLQFTNLYGYSLGKVMDHREYSGSTDFTKKSVFSKIETFKICLMNATNFRKSFRHSPMKKH